MTEARRTPNKTYYDLLGISRDATTEEIRAAYIKLAQQHHPDTCGDEDTDLLLLSDEDLSQTRAFKILTFAYQTLKDPKLRAEYDSELPILIPGWSEARNEYEQKFEQLQEQRHKTQSEKKGILTRINDYLERRRQMKQLFRR